jgi:hypothetical protein
MYCVAYRNGTFLVRRFNGDTVTNVVPRTPNDAIKKAATKEEKRDPGDRLGGEGRQGRLRHHGATVASLPAADIVGPGKLESTDGVWGIRVSTNMDLTVDKLSAGKN